MISKMSCHKGSILNKLFFSLGLLYLVPVFALGLHNGADQVVQKINPMVNLGAVVVDLTSGETLYQRNADKLYIPASNMKLFSEAAALMVLGPDYRFRNRLSTDATQLQQGVLKGNLYLHLSGDPSFTRHDLSQLLSSLRDWGVRDIQGTVYIDSSLASVTAYPPGWMASDLAYSYAAPIAPLILDANRINVMINPGVEAGALALVEADDWGSGAITITNQATTKKDAKSCGVGLVLDQDNHLVSSGCVGVGQWAVLQRLAIKNPLHYAQAMVRRGLAKEQISLHGDVVLGKAPQGALLLANQYSKPLSQLMADTLKPSDNLYADSLYLHAAAQLKGGPVNWNSAQALIKTFLQQQTGIDFTQATFTDGSGLSRYNLVTPQQTISLLMFLYQRFPLAYEYIAALPVSGRDGTLQKRFKTPEQQGFIRAKTGTLTGMNSLSGYMYTTNGHTLAFALFINRLPGSNAGPGRPLLDALCAYFLKLNPGSNRLARVFSPHNRVKFQSSPTQDDIQMRQQAQWRRMESALRLALKGQAVDIVYRSHELVIKDNQSDPAQILKILNNLATKFSFAVAVASAQPMNNIGKPMLLWISTPEALNQRIWTLRWAT